MANAAEAGTILLGDFEVNRLGFGAMRITGDGVWGPPPDPAESIAVLRRAVELGVTFIDTAESYGPYVSEQLIAEALYPYPANLVIATKGGFDRPAPGQWRTNGRPERLREELDGSLRRLRVERIDLWQLHRIDSGVPEAEQFGAIAEFLTQGKIRHVGLSEVSVDQVARARRQFPVVSVQNRYNLVDRQSEPVLDYCEANQIAFIPWYPLLVGKVADGTAPARALRDVALEKGATPIQVAVAWLLARSSVMLPIPGTSNVKHLEENVAAASVRLTVEEMARLG
jgi:aryl-alcohol dehydrogenase-like predicted oxidoreductase